MSVATLKDGSLQLSELVISNSKYSNATGYVAASSTFTAGVSSTSLSTGPITTPEVVFSGSTAGTPYLNTNGTELILSTPYQGGLLFSTPGETAGAPGNQVSLTVDSSQSLSCSGAITCAGNGNFGTKPIETTPGGGSLTFCRNITGGDDELDIVALNTFNPTDLTNPILNIYTSNTSVAPEAPPIVSMTTNTIDVVASLTLSDVADSANKVAFTVDADQALSCSGSITCGILSNFGGTTIETATGGGSLTFCRNLTAGDDELDIVALNTYDPTDLTLSILNIYTSNTSVAPASTPIVSMTTNAIDVVASLTLSDVADSANKVTLSCSGGTDLLVDGTINATAYSGGIGATIVVVSILELPSNANGQLPNQIIPNFVGNASSVYMAMPNGGDNFGYSSLIFTVGFDSTTGTDTSVYVSVTNVGNVLFPNSQIQLSILGINAVI